MGRTIEQWTDKVAHLVRDAAGKDFGHLDIETVGIHPALTQYSADRPRVVIAEQAGTGSAYVSLPAGWVAGTSRIKAVEYPARQNPPTFLGSGAWLLTQDPADVNVEKVLFLNSAPLSSEFVRFTFTAPWPTPDATAATDKIDDQGFEAVSALAASYCCASLAAEAARMRARSLPTNYVDGTERARVLVEVAKQYERAYNRFVGLETDEENGTPTRTRIGTARVALGIDALRTLPA